MRAQVWFAFLLTSCSLEVLPTKPYEENIRIEQHLAARVESKSWVEIRDYQVVRQNYDQSCGAAAIATILNKYYDRSFTELDILGMMPTIEEPYSVSVIQNILWRLGFDSLAVSTDFEGIQSLARPVIVLLRPQLRQSKAGHFVVIDSVRDDRVYLSDPSSGNRIARKEDFLPEWSIRDNQQYGILILVRLNTESASEPGILDVNDL